MGLDWFILEVVYELKGEYPLSQMFWVEQSSDNHYLW